MANGARFIEHKGKEIYYIDYSHIKTTEAFLEVLKSTNAFREEVKASGKRDVLMLVDVTGSYVYGDILEALKKAGKATKPITRKEAVVGITGAKKTLLSIFRLLTGLQLRPFDTIDEAKEWLTEA
jgi:hypothetical protein